MSDEIFFREVNEEIRQDRTRVLWSRFGKWILWVAAAAVLATAAYGAWTAYDRRQANASGDRYLAALDLASLGEPGQPVAKTDDAVTALEALAATGHGAYPDLARLRIAALRETSGDRAAAVTAFDAVTNDPNGARALRDIASIRAGYILVDTGSRDDVRARVEALSGDAEPLRYAAREILGLAAWKAGAADDAKGFFEQLRDDAGTPSGIGTRAGLMLEVIAAGSRMEAAAASTGIPAAAPADAAPTPAPLATPPS